MTVGLGNMKIDGMFLYHRLELSSFAYLLGSAITYQLIWYAEIRNELFQRLTSAALVLHRVGSCKERLISDTIPTRNGRELGEIWVSKVGTNF